MVLDIYHGERGIDLAKWKSNHGLWGVIVKCGGSDDRKWNRYEETTWVEQATQAKALGLHVGAFYYSDALDATDALEDAKHCVHECMRGVQIDMPIYLDIEERSQLDLPMWQLTEVVTTFCNYVRDAGYQVGIYSGYEGFHNMHEDEISSYSLWVAAWRTSWPIWAADYDLWQEGSIDYAGTHYHDNHTVDLPGHIDLDWASDAFVKRIEQGGGKVPTARTGWAETLETCQDPADYAYCTCKVYSCGYSQPKRDHLTIERLKAGTAETDCSYGVGWWLFKGGYLSENPAFYTAIERAYLAEHGFEVIDANAGFVKMQRNDVLLRERNDARGVTGHTALYIGDGLQAEALRTERHDAGYDGSTPGDNDGGETVVRKLTLDWDYILRKREQPSYEPSGGEEIVIESGGIDMGILIHPKNENKIYHWTCSMDEVPYHVSGPEKTAIEHAYALVHGGKRIPTIEMEQADFDAILSGTKARKAWREQGIAAAVKGGA